MQPYTRVNTITVTTNGPKPPAQFTEESWNISASLEVKAMYPTILITGCCGEDSGFWNQSGLATASLKAYFDNVLIPYSDRTTTPYKGIIGGSIGAGAGVLNVQIPAIAKGFGVNWVHLVAHSKGGLNARALLAVKWLQSSSIGVLSLTTLDTPHQGSVAADATEQFRMNAQFIDFGVIQGPPLKEVMASQIATDRQFGTLPDLTQESLKKFNGNAANHTPPPTTRVGTDVRPLKTFALSSDADLDGNRSITSGFIPGTLNEIRGMAAPYPAPVMGFTYNEMYQFIGTTQDLQIAPALCHGGQSLNGVVNCVKLIQSVSGFLLNDLIVTTDSQSYRSNPGAFEPLISSPPARGLIYGNNHNSVPNTRIAEKVFGNLKSITLGQF
jgi:hypothetical protein